MTTVAQSVTAAAGQEAQLGAYPRAFWPPDRPRRPRPAPPQVVINATAEAPRAGAQASARPVSASGGATARTAPAGATALAVQPWAAGAAAAELAAASCYAMATPVAATAWSPAVDAIEAEARAFAEDQDEEEALVLLLLAAGLRRRWNLSQPWARLPRR